MNACQLQRMPFPLPAFNPLAILTLSRSLSKFNSLSLFMLYLPSVTLSLANSIAPNLKGTHQIQLYKPKIAFATSRKLLSFPLGAIPLTCTSSSRCWPNLTYPTRITLQSWRSDTAAILYSSGIGSTPLAHRNFPLTALIVGFYDNHNCQMELKS